MLQVESLVSACAGGSSDRKIACETLAPTDPPEPHPDSPPESFWLSRDEEHDWWDRNAVYERKESTKASNSANLNPAINPNNNNNNSNNSQRFSLNFKSTIIGLPKPQKTSFVDSKNRRNHKPTTNIRLFPKRNVSVGKSNSTLVEPSSPKVSCMGRVRSKRDRNRKLRSSRKSSQEVETKLNKSGKKPGFFESFRSIFRTGQRKEKPDGKTDPRAAMDSNTEAKSVAARARHSTSSLNDVSFEESTPRNSASEIEPPGLGGMMRFASGRRSESWGVGDSEGHVAQ